MAEAEKSEPVDPNAMALATVDAQGLPNVRMVLLKAMGPAASCFYTNCESAKGADACPKPQGGAPAFTGRACDRQMRMRGPVEMVSEDEADAYFATRPREQPHRRLGIATVEAIAEPRRFRRGRPALHGRACRQGRGAPPLTGRATGWCRSRSSSGIAGRIGCTTGSCSGARIGARPSSRRGSIRSGGEGLFCPACRRSPMKSGRR